MSHLPVSPGILYYHTCMFVNFLGGIIILAIRNAKKGVVAIDKIKTVAKKATVIIKLVDISEFGCIRNFVEDIKQEYKKIDVLINNAATISPKFQQTLDGNEVTFVTNYLGKLFYKMRLEKAKKLEFL